MSDELIPVGEWDDTLYWCPSQCYLEFRWRDQVKTLYLRWRHHDPWTAEIITFGLGDIPVKWSGKLDFPYFTQDDDLDQIKEAAIRAAQEYLNAKPKE